MQTVHDQERLWGSLRAVGRILERDPKTVLKVIRAGKIRSRILPGVVYREYSLADARKIAGRTDDHETADCVSANDLPKA